MLALLIGEKMEWLLVPGIFVFTWLWFAAEGDGPGEAVGLAVVFAGVLAAIMGAATLFDWVGGAVVAGLVIAAAIAAVIADVRRPDSAERVQKACDDLDVTTTPQLLEKLEAAKTRTQQRADRWWRAPGTRQWLEANIRELEWKMELIRSTYAEHPNEQCAILRRARSGVENQILDAAFHTPGAIFLETAEVTRPYFGPTLCTCNGEDPEAQRRAEEEWREAIIRNIPESLKRVQEISKRVAREAGGAIPLDEE